MRNGRLNGHEILMLRKAVDILSDWVEWREGLSEEAKPLDDYEYGQAVGVMVGLEEFVAIQIE